jgi:hypothetical protein
MFSIETTYYCEDCKTVTSKNWQFENPRKAYLFYNERTDSLIDKKAISVGFIELRYIPNKNNPMNNYLMLTSNIGVDSHSYTASHWLTSSIELMRIYDEMTERNVKKEAA